MLEPWQKVDATEACEPIEAVELYNVLNNERDLNSRCAAMFRKFEFEMKWGKFIADHCEARVMDIAHDAADRYVKLYCPKGTNPLTIFPLDVRRECAALIVREFEVEKEAGNSWL